MNKYLKSTTKITLVLLGFMLLPTQGISDRDTFDVLMTPEEKAAVEDYIETSKTMSAEAQSKLQEALDNWGKLQDNFEKCSPELQDFINKVNAAGFRSKINTTLGGLKKFDSGLQSIMDKKEKMDQVIGIYDRYVPDVENPFRSLEVLENMLTDIENYALPKEVKYEYLKNPPVFLIRTAINYFRTGIQSAHTGLKNIQKGIRDRAGNCLGYVGGDEYGDKSDPKRKAYEQINIGEVICYTKVRPVGGEVWKDQTGNLVYVWSSGSWTKLDCGFGTANKVFKYWKLANGSAISSYDLIYWCTGNYVDVFIKAEAKGRKQFRKLTSIDDCQEKVLEMLSLDRDLSDLMKLVNNNSEVFVSKYIFKKDGIHESADLLTRMANDIVVLSGYVKNSDGNGISGATVSIEGNFATVSIDTDSRGYFEILAEIPQKSQNGIRLRIKVVAEDYTDLKEKTRLQDQCMDMGILPMKDKDEECGKNEEWGNTQDKCICKSGFTENKKGDCVKIKECDDNEYFDVETEDCECDDGFLENKKGDCIKEKECGENEHFDVEVPDCVCDEGFTENDEGKCVSDDEEVMDECSLEYIKALTFMLEVLVADTKLRETELISNINKFNKEINDQSSNICGNQTVGDCYAAASRLVDEMAENVSDIYDIAVVILKLQVICPDLTAQMQSEGLTVKNLISSILGVGANTYRDKLAEMSSRLGENGCDEDESKDDGEKVVPPDGDPGLRGDGGDFVEVPGDSDDNDGDGRQDEQVEDISGKNITFLLDDTGSIDDDVFNLSVTGYGFLGQTPAGGKKYYRLNLSPGKTYTATVLVVMAPDNVGTYTLTVYYKGQYLDAISGAPAQGSSEFLRFTVPTE